MATTLMKPTTFMRSHTSMTSSSLLSPQNAPTSSNPSTSQFSLKYNGSGQHTVIIASMKTLQ